ncbi:MAG TPA: MBL fold metallo-hydrolase, partial [Pseudomonadales bacterium]|nr:MBL fold metallo-hydrolase [Pseudomonadales bacterium]
MTSNPAPAKPEPSATLVLVRDSDAGLEVFLQQRHHNIPFLGGAHVFPGGKVEASDHDPRWRALSSLTEQHANAVLGVDAGGLSYWVAAIRECYEESGILMARQYDGTAASPTQLGGWPVADFDFLEACETAGLQLCTEQLIYYAHWITPAHLPKRFDTRFFIARAPTGQTGAHDGYESIDSLWISAQNALQME